MYIYNQTSFFVMLRKTKNLIVHKSDMIITFDSFFII